MSHKESTSDAPPSNTLIFFILLCAMGLQVAKPKTNRPDQKRLTVQDRLDPNTAEWFELAQLPGVGPSLADRMIKARQVGGSFRASQDLRNVRGLGPKTLRKLDLYLRYGAPPSVTLTGERPVDNFRPALSPLESGG